MWINGLIVNSSGILSTLTPELSQQLAANGTSFDGFIKHRIAEMNAAGIPVKYPDLNSSLLVNGINACASLPGKASEQTFCDFAMAFIQELCQAVPDQLSSCDKMPSINSYMKNRNLVDGQTDKLVWQHFSKIEDTVLMEIHFKPHENEFLAKDGYYQIYAQGVNATKGSKLCPSGNCQYSIENGQFSPNTFSGGYVFEGILKVSIVTNDTINSNFYPFRVDLDKTASQEKQGQTTEILTGSIKFGRNTFSPDFEYNVTNGQLLVDPISPVLTLEGVKS